MIEDSYLIILGIIVIVLFIALIILTYKVFELQHKVSKGVSEEVPEANLPTVSKEVQTEKPGEIKEQPKIEKITEPKNGINYSINLTEGVSDINESMKRFTMKYNMDSATLASMDGLSLASSHPDSDIEAANLTARYRDDEITEIGDTHIVPLKYKSEEILLIFRTPRQMTKEQTELMMRDGRMILSNWL